MTKKLTIKLILFACVFVLNSCHTNADKNPDTEAKYVGENDMAWAIAHYVEYPAEEMQFNRAGIVKVTFQVDKQGKVNEVKAVFDEEITQAEIAIGRKKLEDKEVLPINFPVLHSLIKSVEKLNFEPAKKNGKPIDSNITTSVEFMLI